MDDVKFLKQQIVELQATIRSIREERRPKIIGNWNTRQELQKSFHKANKRERELLVNYMPPLSWGHYDLLKKTGFMTGSAVYSEAIPSDEDWVINVPPHTFETVTLGGDENSWKYGDMNVLFGHYEGKMINIMCVDPETFKLWQDTTNFMAELNRYNVFKPRLRHKWARVMLFRAIKDVLQVPEMQPADHYDISDALNLKRCRCCGRESRNFISVEYERFYEKDGICDRCRTELNLGDQI